MPPPFPVLFEDNHLLVVNKPAELATMGAAAGEPSLVELAKAYLKQKYAKPGNVYLGVVSRLDAFVTGVVVLARTSKAAARLNPQFSSGTASKLYWALIPNQVDLPAEGTWEHAIYKDDAAHRMRIAPRPDARTQSAKLSLRTLATLEDVRIIEITLLTGRKHQIRTQLSHLGAPVLGDRKYGSSRAFPKGIALHSRQLTIEHPISNTRMNFTAPLPDYWQIEPRSLNLS